MKRLFLSKLFISTALVLCVVLALSQTAFGQEVATTVSKKVSDLTELIKVQDRIASALEKLVEEDSGSVDPDVGTKAYAINNSVPNPTCLDNYASWNHSGTFDPDAEWNLDFMPKESYSNGDTDDEFIDEQFVDLNGDGLADYFYRFSKYYSGYGGQSWDYTCVYLNNGSGFDAVYRCYSVVDYSPLTQDYYGDCADMP